MGWIFLGIFLFTALSFVTFFILMSEGIIKRTDSTVKIERAIEGFIGGVSRIFFHGHGVVANEIEKSRLKFKCQYCDYLDDVNREFCPNCTKNNDGFTIEEIRPFKCKHCHNRFDKQFRYCPRCNRNEKGQTLGVTTF